MDEQHIDEVVFVEIKSGSSQLSSNERSLRDAIEAKRVRWHEYRVDPVLSKMPAPNATEEPPRRKKRNLPQRTHTPPMHSIERPNEDQGCPDTKCGPDCMEPSPRLQ